MIRIVSCETCGAPAVLWLDWLIVCSAVGCEWCKVIPPVMPLAARRHRRGYCTEAIHDDRRAAC